MHHERAKLPKPGQLWFLKNDFKMPKGLKLQKSQNSQNIGQSQKMIESQIQFFCHEDFEKGYKTSVPPFRNPQYFFY